MIRRLIDSMLKGTGTFIGIFGTFGMKTAIAAVVIYGTAMILVPENFIADVFPAMESLWLLAKLPSHCPAYCWNGM
jgi:hypothetical protein